MPDDAVPPDVPLGYAYAYGAFCELSGDRQMGFASGPIPFSAIDTYARRYGISDADEFEQLRDDIRLLDRLFLAVAAEQKT